MRCLKESMGYPSFTKIHQEAIKEEGKKFIVEFAEDKSA